MKFLKLLICCLAANVCFADNAYYCPERIECTRAGDVTSCLPVGGNFSYNKKMWVDGYVQKSIYQFEFASSPSDEWVGKYSENKAFCQYKNKNGKYSRLITIDTSIENLFASPVDESQWEIYGAYGKCISQSSKDCPFIVKK